MRSPPTWRAGNGRDVKQNPDLSAALAVFYELGWGTADVSEAATLPLGTPEQQAIARRGLASGDWGEYVRERGTHRWKTAVDANDEMLGIFAVRVGVSAARAAVVLPRRATPVLIRVVEERGAAFVQAYARRRGSLGPVIVPLVIRLGLDLPDDPGYLRAWAWFASHVLTGNAAPRDPGEVWPDAELLSQRFEEHLEACVAAQAFQDGAVEEIVAPAVEKGWLGRGVAVELAFTALNVATRPVDRKLWLRVLDDLSVTDAEILARGDLVVSVLSHGDSQPIGRLAPALIAGGDDSLLGDVLAVSLPTTVKKTTLLLLRAMAQRERPSGEVVELAAALIPAQLVSGDDQIVKAAKAVTAAWGIEPPTDQDPQELVPWQDAPRVWDGMRFSTPEPTPAALTEAAAVLFGRGGSVHDVEVDRFLVLANEVAATDLEGCRSALAGVQESWTPGLAHVGHWRSGNRAHLRASRNADPVGEREAQVMRRLGELPVLVSMPSWEDLRIEPADLLARLQEYERLGVPVSEADLGLALMRTDHRTADQELRASLRGLRVAVETGGSAGAIAADYLDQPQQEPALVEVEHWGFFVPAETRPAAALRRLPSHFVDDRMDAYAFPGWGDAGWIDLRQEDWVDIGPLARQAARRSAPLTPGMAVNLIAAQRAYPPAAGDELTTAVREAWERGLLRPGVPDVGLLDWHPTPTALAAFARVCLELAEESMLALVWPLLDDLVTLSLQRPKLLAGTADLVQAMLSLLPSVRHAVSAGATGADALALPGVRALAERGGSTRAAKLARSLVADLPAATPAPIPAQAPPPRSEADLTSRWTQTDAAVPVIGDGVGFTLVEDEWKRICLDATLPSGERFLWNGVSDFELFAGRLPVRSIAERTARHPDLWLWLTPRDGSLWVEPIEMKDGLPVRDTRPEVTPTELTVATVAALLVTWSRVGEAGHRRSGFDESAPRPTADGVREAIRLLLEKGLNPRPLARLIDLEPTWLPTLWPVLAQAVSAAATLQRLPTWLNPVLDTALFLSPQLVEARRHGWMPVLDEAWPGLRELAQRKGTGKALIKARELLAELESA